MGAKVVYYDPIYNIENVEMGEHLFGFGGMEDGFCYRHSNFDCIDNLTPEEMREVTEAVYEPD